MENYKKNVNLELGFLKSKKGNACAFAKCNLGYRDVTLTFDELLIAELFEMPVSKLYALKNEWLETLED